MCVCVCVCGGTPGCVFCWGTEGPLNHVIKILVPEVEAKESLCVFRGTLVLVVSILPLKERMLTLHRDIQISELIIKGLGDRYNNITFIG